MIGFFIVMIFRLVMLVESDDTVFPKSQDWFTFRHRDCDYFLRRDENDTLFGHVFKTSGEFYAGKPNYMGPFTGVRFGKLHIFPV